MVGPRCVLQLALPFSFPPGVDKFGEKSFPVVRTNKISPTCRCCGLTDNPWANGYVMRRKLELLLRLKLFVYSSQFISLQKIPWEI